MGPQLASLMPGHGPAFSKQPSLALCSTRISQAPTWIPKLSQRYFCLWIALNCYCLGEIWMGDLLPLTLLSCQCHLPYILKLYRLYLIIYYFQVIFLVRCELETHFFFIWKGNCSSINSKHFILSPKNFRAISILWIKFLDVYIFGKHY